MLETNKNAVTVIYSGGDVQVPFVFYDAADLVVLVETTMKTMGTDYTVTGAGNTAGGKVSFVNAPADGARVTVIRKIDFTQLLSIPQNGIIPEGALSKALDRIVMMIQQLEERADRAVEYPEGTDKNDVANAQNILDSIEEGTQTITNAVQVAEATLESSNTALVASNKALNDAEAKRVLVNQNGDTQVERILTEGNKQDSRIETEGNDQTTRVTNEGNKQYNRVKELGDAKYSDIHTKHQAAVSELAALRDSSVVLVDTHKVQGVASVEEATQQAIQQVTELPEYALNMDAVLQSEIVKNFNGLVAGKGGKWKCDLVGTITPTALEWNTGYEAGCTTALKDFSIVEDPDPDNLYIPHNYLGALSWLDNKQYGVIIGDSGIPYLTYSCSYVKASKKVWRVNIHPYHGDVRADFTLGKAYKFEHFWESTSSLDQQTGVRDVNEYFLGGSTATWVEQAGKAYHDFGSNKTISHPHRTGTSRVSAMFKITVHGVYDAVSPVLQLGFNRGYDWENIFNLPMTYDAEAHTLTYTGTHSSPWGGSWSECSWVVKMASGKMLNLTPQSNVVFQVDSETPATWDASGYNSFNFNTTYNHNHAGAVDFLDVIKDKLPEVAPDPEFSANSFVGWYSSFGETPVVVRGGQVEVTGRGEELSFQGDVGIFDENLKAGTQYLVEVEVTEMPSGRITVNSNADSDTTITAAGTYSTIITTDNPLPASTGVRIAFRNIAQGDVVKVSRFSVKEVTVECTLNVGYRDGKVWKSQLLGDAYICNEGTLRLKLNKKGRGGTTQISIAVQLLNADGEWVDGVLTTPWVDLLATPFGFRGWLAENELQINLKETYAALGYTSVLDMRVRGAVRAYYQTRPPVWRPDMSSINSPAVADKVYFFSSTRDQGIPFLMQDLIGHVPMGTGGSNTNWSRVTSAADTYSGLGLGYIRYESEGAPRYPAATNTAVVVFFRLIKKNGTLWMQARFRELVQDNGNWGDCCYIDENGSDRITTTTDDNGNVVLSGVVSYDTEIPY